MTGLARKPFLNRRYYTIAHGKYKLLFPEKDTGFVRISRFQQIIDCCFVQPALNSFRAFRARFETLSGFFRFAQTTLPRNAVKAFYSAPGDPETA